MALCGLGLNVNLWPCCESSKMQFTHVTKCHEEKKNNLGWLVVMIGGPKTMTERNPLHFLNALVTCYNNF